MYNMNFYITAVTHLFTSREQHTILAPSCCTIYPFILHYWKQFVMLITCIHLPVILLEGCQCDSLCFLLEISTSVLLQISDDIELIGWAVMFG